MKKYIYKIILTTLLTSSFTTVKAEEKVFNITDAYNAFVYFHSFHSSKTFHKCLKKIQKSTLVHQFYQIGDELRQLSLTEEPRAHSIRHTIHKACALVEDIVSDCYAYGMVSIREHTAGFRDGVLCSYHRDKIYKKLKKDFDKDRSKEDGNLTKTSSTGAPAAGNPPPSSTTVPGMPPAGNASSTPPNTSPAGAAPGATPPSSAPLPAGSPPLASTPPMDPSAPQQTAPTGAPTPPPSTQPILPPAPDSGTPVPSSPPPTAGATPAPTPAAAAVLPAPTEAVIPPAVSAPTPLEPQPSTAPTGGK